MEANTRLLPSLKCNTEIRMTLDVSIVLNTGLFLGLEMHS